MTGELRNVPYTDIIPDPQQPRKTFDKGEMARLVRSIGSEGLLQPVTIRTIDDENASYMLVAGERRWRAIGELGWETIPAIIRNDLNYDTVMRLQMLENSVREGLNPVEEARAVKAMVDAGLTYKEVGDAIGWGYQGVAYSLKLLDAREDVLHLLAHGALSIGMVYAMSSLSYNGQGRVLVAFQTGKLVSTSDVKALSDRIWAEENQMEIFQETKLTPEQVTHLRTFGKALETVGMLLDRVHRMQDKNPKALAEALAAERSILKVRIDAAVYGLNRVGRLLTEIDVDLRTRDVEEVVVEKQSSGTKKSTGRRAKGGSEQLEKTPRNAKRSAAGTAEKTGNDKRRNSKAD